MLRPVHGTSHELEKEVRISCPDATGLGCDVTRMLLDFGLRILHGDMSTDGKWCFLIFKVSSYPTRHNAQSLPGLPLPCHINTKISALTAYHQSNLTNAERIGLVMYSKRLSMHNIHIYVDDAA